MPGDYTLGKVCSLLDNLRRNFESQTKRKLKTVLVFMLFMQVAVYAVLDFAFHQNGANCN